MTPVVDLAPVRCPDLDPSVRAEMRRTTPRPSADATDTDGVQGLSRDAVRGWLSRLELSEQRKNSAGTVAIEAYDRCRGLAAPVAPPKVS